MKIDNSMMSAFFVCPWYYFEKYEAKIEKIRKTDALSFGKRMHKLLEQRLRGFCFSADGQGGFHHACGFILTQKEYEINFCPHCFKRPFLPITPCLEEFEPEAQAMFAAYCQQYPVEPFDVLDVERYFEVPLPGSDHVYIGKFDGIVREHDTGKLCIAEHKTEKRGGKRNLPVAWAVRPQVSLYIWAAEQIYQEPFDQILLDVLTRQSPAGQIGPTFPPRQHLQRTDKQKMDAVQNITWVADQIEKLRAEFVGKDHWPFNGEQCHNGMWQCDFFPLHIYGADEFTLARDFQQAEEYLTL